MPVLAMLAVLPALVGLTMMVPTTTFAEPTSLNAITLLTGKDILDYRTEFFQLS